MPTLENGTFTKTGRKLFFPKTYRSARLTMAMEPKAMKKILRMAEEQKKSAAFIARKLIERALAI